MSKPKTVMHDDGLKVTIDKSEEDGRLIVFIDTPIGLETANGSPDIRVWLNDALMYSEGRVGEDLVESGDDVPPEGR